jgi:hypothetical protein
MANILEDLTRYRVKVEKDGKEVVNIPGILCIPGLLAAPKMSILGMIAAPLLGCSIHVENAKSIETDIENAVKNAAKTVSDTAEKAVKTIREELDKAWESLSAEDEPEEAEDTAEDIAEDIAEEPEADDIPTIQAEPDDSDQAE